MGWIGRAWRGQERLCVVFWVYGVLLGIGFGVVRLIVGTSTPAGMALSVFQIVYSIWLWVSEWRCAFNTDWKFWGYVVRVVVIIGPLLVVIGLAVGGTLLGGDLVKAAQIRKECDRESADYATKGGKDILSVRDKCRQRKLHEMNSMNPSAMPQAKNTVVILPGQESAYQSCTKAMTDYAVKSNVPPQQYIAGNQAYLQQCVQYYAAQGKKP